MIHTPAQSTALLALLRGLTPLTYTDVSYGNDVCDSVYIDQYKMQIFLPNVTNPFGEIQEVEDYIGFQVSYFDADKDINAIYIDREFTVLELVHFLNALEWEFDTDGHTESTLNEIILYSDSVKDETINFEQFVLPYLDMEIEDAHMFPNELGGQITTTRIK